MRMKIPACSALLSILLCLACAGAALAADDPVGTAAVMDLGMGARALGMGGAHIAVAEDASTVYYNPAGLALIDGRSVTSMYTNQFGAVGYLSLGYAQKNVGIGLLTLNASGIEQTDEFADVTGVFGMTDMTIMAAYGRTVIDNLSVGGTLKYYSQTMPESSGKGITGDVGVLYRLADGKVSAGAVARNVLGSVKYSGGATDAFDRSWGVGIAIRPMRALLIAADAVIGEGFSARAGAEYRLGLVALRAGAAFGSGQTSMTAGAGFALANFKIDYAYQTHSVLPDSHKLSLGMRF
ncbi:MAG TPA: hypothetical protein DCL63_07895 [Firmicutes bacterium]|nr:hypothetical protein [Bacillota bacterium]